MGKPARAAHQKQKVAGEMSASSQGLTGPAPSDGPYMLWTAGRQSGPYSRADLDARLESGTLNLHDFVRLDGEDEWRPVSEIIRKAARQTRPAAEKESSADAELAVIALAMKTTRRELETVTRSDLRCRENGLGELTDKAVALSRRIRRVMGWATVVLGVAWCAVWGLSWETPRSTARQLLEWHYQLIELDARRQTPGSAEWSGFVARHHPQIVRLAKSLRPRATGTRPERELLWAIEQGLLEMLKEGLQGPAERRFMLHMGNATRAMNGEREMSVLSGDGREIRPEPGPSASSPPSSVTHTPVRPQ